MFLNYKKWHKENFPTCCLRGWGCHGEVQQHHVKHVGTGRNRKKELPEHLTVISMCEKHHAEFHNFTNEEFIKIYNFNPFEQVVNQLMVFFNENLINKTLDDEFRNMDYLEGK